MPVIKDPTVPKKKTAKKAPPKKADAELVELLYPNVEVKLFQGDEALTPDTAKELLGWQEEGAGESFGNNFLLTDKFGKKVRCLHNLTNRPYYPQLADDYVLELLRKKWRLNFETIKVDQNGMVHDGQHRLIGLVLSEQVWKADKNLPSASQRWGEFWPTPPTMEALVVLGMDGADDTVNTIGTGKPRTLTDVLYRCAWFNGRTEKERQQLARITAYTIKLLWWRTAQNLISFAPRRPHSESLQFIANHERILDCVKFIYDEAGTDNKLTPFIPLGYAAGLLYLMGSAGSESEAYAAAGNESVLDWKLLDKAHTFWVEFASNGRKTEALREALERIPVEVGGSYARDLRCGLIIKAWNLFSDGEKITEEGIELKGGFNEFNQPILGEVPRIGGIDVDYAEDVTPSRKTPNESQGECPRGNSHEWTTESGETFCKKCLAPKTTTRAKGK